MVKTASVLALANAEYDVVQRVRVVFAIGDDVETIQWLEARPEIASALLAARPAVEEIFGAGTKVTLELVHDPELETDSGSLFALIQTDLEPAEARPLMKSFRDRWWTSAPASVGEGLTFGLAYR